MRWNVLWFGLALACAGGPDLAAQAAGVALVVGLEERLGITCGGGHGFGICLPEVKGADDVFLVVDGDPGWRLRAHGCTPDNLGETQQADGVAAYSCGGTWHPVYLGSSGRVFPHPDTFEAPFSVEDLEPFDAITAKVYQRYGHDYRALLLAEILERRGESGLIAFLVAQAHLAPEGLHNQRRKGGAWQLAVNELSEEGRASLLTGLRSREPAEWVDKRIQKLSPPEGE